MASPSFSIPTLCSSSSWTGHQESPPSVFAMDLPLTCGSPLCNRALPSPPKRCKSCRYRAYCDTLCQRADWPTHRLHCTPRSSLTDRDKTAFAYHMKHQHLLFTIAHRLFRFEEEFRPLRGSDRLSFLDVARTQFVHIKLREVANPAPGRWNRVSFLSAKLEDIHTLSNQRILDVTDRLERRFPAFCFGLSIVNAEGFFSSISTVTHPFKWPTPAYGQPLLLKKAIDLIRLMERMWMLEAWERLAQRMRDREQNPGPGLPSQ
ncbi:hypothetical protein CVT26_005957 [Gymnopilus dilepis]|uniref:MYND-type domain-containing protein n=1 Tax=Gymnopilus dilepis TaxID=231916 RepID=A0A409Y1S0_9AGAR|nr:hypothetical protein CVT26_005957 [Gymnopilus dilepis]